MGDEEMGTLTAEIRRKIADLDVELSEGEITQKGYEKKRLELLKAPSETPLLHTDVQQGAGEHANNGACIQAAAKIISLILAILFLPLSIFLCIRIVADYERAIVFRMGRLRYGGVLGSGVYFILPCIDDFFNIDLRTISFNVAPQEVLTRDSVTVSVDAVVYYRILDPLKAVTQVSNYTESSQLLAATTLRNILGTRNLTELLADRDSIQHTMLVALDEATSPWGVKIERVEIKNVSLPESLQRSMASEAEASREARAKVIAAEGEMNASRTLKEASDIMSASPTALQLRYLQTLSTIAAEKNSTIIFPIPVELLRGFK